MNIGFSACVLQGGRTGVASYVVNLLHTLQETDRVNTYDVILPQADAHLIRDGYPGFSKHLLPNVLSSPVPNIAWHSLALPARSRQQRYDLVHIPSYRRLPLHKGAPIVATVHDLATLHLDGKYDAARMLYNRRIVPSLIRRADHVITVSHFTAGDLVNLVGYPAEKISVIYSGIQQQHYHAIPADVSREHLKTRYGLEGPFVVFVSRVEHPAKNHLRLIQAFERLKARKPSDLKLVMAGADWNGADAVKDYAARSPVARDVVFTGFVSLEDIPHFYSACEVMAYPSLFEGFGFPIVEAMACGAPVICSNTTSMKEVATDLAPTFDPLNVDAIADALEMALQRGKDPGLTARAMAYAATFDWRETARKVMDVYRHVAGLPSGAGFKKESR
ncbi:MAG: glycosyltransferase family 4 protein [Gammaproteobacteria bacterium]|nr:glycosyltransferase family 4 protein [Gammaproteobacteria bacterium]